MMGYNSVAPKIVLYLELLLGILRETENTSNNDFCWTIFLPVSGEDICTKHHGYTWTFVWEMDLVPTQSRPNSMFLNWKHVNRTQ